MVADRCSLQSWSHLKAQLGWMPKVAHSRDAVDAGWRLETQLGLSTMAPTSWTSHSMVAAS